MKKVNKKPVFKSYDQGQQMLLPPSLEEMIEAKHPVRLVNQIVNKINLQELYSQYEGGGAPSYSPRMMLKIIIYGYLSNIYSSRKIEASVKENIHFMWLSGMSKPDHNSINRFRSNKLKPVIKQIFSQIVILLNKEGILSIKDIYTDGTKIEANANKYTFVWGKSIRVHKEKIVKQIEELWSYAEEVSKQELIDTKPRSYKEIEPEKVKETIEEINKSLEGKPINRKIKQKLKRVKRVWPEQLSKYKEQEAKLKGRNSYSKTDEDATFMRMKEDHMQNGQLKPGYNWQISTNNQFIVNYTTHQTASDTVTLIEHLLEYKDLYGSMPEQLTADAGYGSEENYKFAEDNDIEAFIKYNYFHKEETKKWKSDIRQIRNLYYNEDKDCYYCPMGQEMSLIKEKTTKSKTGFVQILKQYQAKNCNGCPLRGACHNSPGNRIIEVNHRASKYKSKAKELLTSPEGIKKRSRRSIEPESVFGNIKHNKGFKRFLLRGMEKINIELGLISIAHNIAKLSNISELAY
jgi:transposase